LGTTFISIFTYLVPFATSYDLLNTDAIQSLSKILGQISGVSSPHQTKEKSLYKNMSSCGTDQQHVDIKPLDFYLWGHLKTLVYSAPIENGETLNQHIFMPVNSQHQYLQKGAAVHDQTCPCMHLFRQKTF
jgi:hypothetical protein